MVILTKFVAMLGIYGIASRNFILVSLWVRQVTAAMESERVSEQGLVFTRCITGQFSDEPGSLSRQLTALVMTTNATETKYSKKHKIYKHIKKLTPVQTCWS